MDTLWADQGVSAPQRFQIITFDCASGAIHRIESFDKRHPQNPLE